MRQGTQTRDGPFWAEHYYEPCKSGMIDASGWAIYTTDPDTGEKVLVGCEVCLPQSLKEYSVERLNIIRGRLKITPIMKIRRGGCFSQKDVIVNVQKAKAIKKALKIYQGEE